MSKNNLRKIMTNEIKDMGYFDLVYRRDRTKDFMASVSRKEYLGYLNSLDDKEFLKAYNRVIIKEYEMNKE